MGRVDTSPFTGYVGAANAKVTKVLETNTSSVRIETPNDPAIKTKNNNNNFKRSDKDAKQFDKAIGKKRTSGTHASNYSVKPKK